MTMLNRMLARGVVALTNSARKLQSLQMRLTADEVKDGMEHLEPYGFTSCPLPGAEGLAAFLGGDRSHGVVVVVADRRYRLTGLESGEVAIYTDEGDKIHLRRGRAIDIVTSTLNITASEAMNINAPTVNISAASTVNFDTPSIHQTGTIISDDDQVSGGISLTGHVHAGVQSGDDTSGVPQ